MKTKGSKNLTWTQRLQLELLLRLKLSKSNIAKELGVSVRTVYYEIKRGEYEHKVSYLDYVGQKMYRTVKRYSPDLAQNRTELAMTSKGAPLKLGKDYAFVEYIERRVLQDKLSPCAVLGEINRKKLFSTRISKTTLYRYISIGVFENLSMSNLRKSQSAYQTVRAKRPPRGTSIEKRPKEVSERRTFGHWEMDCVCGSTRAAFLVLSERLTRQEIIFAMPDQTSDSVIHCLNVLERRYGKLFRKVFKSITMDNGSEFSNVDGIEKSIYRGKRTITFYCHPYTSCERGTNERLNREIRRLVPKGSDLSRFSPEDVKAIENWVNNYPRQVLGFATSGELYAEQLAKLV